MRQKGREPNVITYYAAFSAREKAKQSEKALELLEEMRQKGLELNVITYSAAISACEVAELWQKVWGLLQHLRNGACWVAGCDGQASVVAAEALFHSHDSGSRNTQSSASC